MRTSTIKATRLFDTPEPEPDNRRKGAKGDQYKLRPREPLVFVCENMDLALYDSEIATITEAWKAGVHIAEIAERIGRSDVDEMAIILIGLGHRGRIGERPGGYAGMEGVAV